MADFGETSPDGEDAVLLCWKHERSLISRMVNVTPIQSLSIAQYTTFKSATRDCGVDAGLENITAGTALAKQVESNSSKTSRQRINLSEGSRS